MSKKALIVEDDPQYQMLIQKSLEHDFELTIVSDGKGAFEQLAVKCFDLVVLDWVLGDIEGVQICSYVKSQERLKGIPVILLTGKDGIDNLILGFDAGADDYMTKPFHLKELLLRAKARVRYRERVSSGAIFLQGLTIDTEAHKVTIEGDSSMALNLTPIEYRLLTYFSTNLDLVLSRGQILDRVWPDNLNITERTVDSHISNLRKKLSSSEYTLEAVAGAGYRFRRKENLLRAA